MSAAAAGLLDLAPRALPNYEMPKLQAGQRAIVIGMGGGCDVFAAVAMANMWQSQCESGALVLSANCIGPRPLPDDHEPVTSSLYKLPADPVPLQPGDEAYGSTRLELSVSPRGAEGSPYLIQIPTDGKSGQPLEEVTKTNSAAVMEALQALRVDLVVAVDCGGDSLTGGFDFEGGSFEFGRDRQVLHALAASGVPFVQIILGPGCDGESSIEAMQKAVQQADASGTVLGIIPLDALVPQMALFTQTLRPSRTPNILAHALQVVKKRQAGEAPVDADDESEHCVIRRHGGEASIPWGWLTVGLVLKGGA